MLHGGSFQFVRYCIYISLSTSQDSLMATSAAIYRLPIYCRNCIIYYAKVSDMSCSAVYKGVGRECCVCCQITHLRQGEGAWWWLVTTLRVSGARRLLCCSSGQGMLGCRLHACNCTPGTVFTHCKYPYISVNIQYLYNITLSVGVALHRWYKLDKVQSLNSLHKDSTSMHARVVPCTAVQLVHTCVGTGAAAAHHPE